ncbi:MAG TPA: enoyl-CoA hydratase/isomerase family protein [Actinomycetota bacterium]|nr:enoyl-CoA hydratase/isomerase family protein [Actinomycetota bacterium]
MSDSILLERKGRVAVLTLNVPDKRNAMSAEMTGRFPEALREVAAMDGVRALVVTGAGSAFCAGGDLGFLHSGPRDVPTIRDKMTSFYPRFSALLDLDIPTIAAINGPAIGAGLCLALMCDLRVAADDAPMSMPFVRIGIHPGMLATALLSRAVSHTWAAEMLYTGRNVTGAEAAGIGLVNRTVARDRVLDEALALAGEVAANAPLALRYVKQGLRHAFRRTMDEAAAWEGFAQPVTMATDDVIEGLKAVRERRSPEFEGR